jgi:ABC-2 type transport system ATP-binding protein
MSVSIQHLTKIYGTQRAIDGISFEAHSGEVLGFLGPNGAGKSTTMKIATGYIRPSSGTVVVDGVDVLQAPLDARQRVGYLPEHNPLYLDMYVHEYLRFMGRLSGLNAKTLATRVPEVVAMTGLGPEQHKKIGMLSKGYRQRVGLAQALLHNPPVLILDEPTTGLDPNQVVEIRKLIQELGRTKTVIFSSHILNEVEAIAQRVVIIHQGQVVKDARIDELRSGMQTTQVVQVEFEKPGFDPAPLQATEGVLAVKPVSQTRYTVQAQPGVDVRKVIFAESVRQENPLLGLTAETAHLEDVFRLITSQ